MKMKSFREKKLLAGDEKRFWALKSHGLSADEKKFGTHHLLIKVNNLANLKIVDCKWHQTKGKRATYP
jgi:hypothetical protein